MPLLVLPPPPSSSSLSASVPSAASGASAASNAENNSVVARQHAQEKKYPLWKYVTRKQGPGAKFVGGGNVLWTCNFCNIQYKSTYYLS
jgi:hypothetical protein